MSHRPVTASTVTSHTTQASQNAKTEQSNNAKTRDIFARKCILYTGWQPKLL